jgi:tRNA dimethylallyltransferase
MERSVWLIGGATASGKSALALRLAQALDGEIVNADSMQIYADLRVLTARPSEAETARAPHHLYGVADGADVWSVGRWLRAAADVLDGIAARGRPAVVVGGTGLYVRALTQGLAEIPDVPAEVHLQTQGMWDEGGEAAVRRALKAADPVGEAKIEAGDRQRLLRALAVVSFTGRPLSMWQAQTTPLLAPDAWRGVVVEPDRATLYAQCDARFSAMLDAGGLEEAKALLSRQLDPRSPILKAVGVRELARFFDGEIALSAAIAEARQATRNYAKRQLTWFRNQTPDWPRVADSKDGAVETLLASHKLDGAGAHDGATGF